MFFLGETMKFLIVFTLALATVTSKYLYSHSIEVPVFENEARITNGKNAAPGQFYYQVGIHNLKFGKMTWCGGSLIGNNWILTAAHCFYGASSALVYLGSTKILVGEKKYNVSRKDMIRHPRFDPNNAKNDIGLMRIPTTRETGRIGIVRIPSNNNDKYIGDIAVISGWGITSDDSKTLSNNLKYATVKVSPGIYCYTSYEHQYDIDTNMCVASVNTVSACDGDSGAPLVLDGQNLQIGLFSFGGESGCERGLPTVFTRVGVYLDWIKSKTGIDY